jgi:uncharacterized membrane protein YfcA
LLGVGVVRILVVSIAVLAIAALMTMTGRGGGNFHVLVLVIAGQPMHQAATTGQFILMLVALAGALFFHRHRLVDWKLAMVIDPPTDLMALAGGYFSAYVSGLFLKFVLAGLLVSAGFLMLVRLRDTPISKAGKFGYWHRTYGDQEYVVNLWLAIPATAAVGLAAGAVGIAGGSFKVPLMVLLCGVPMRVAVGTSSAMTGVTALMGFAGHAASGHFDAQWVIPVACAAVLGGVIGGKFAIRTRPEKLKKIFAYTTLGAAVVMVVNALLTAKGS